MQTNSMKNYKYIMNTFVYVIINNRFFCLLEILNN